MASMGICEFGFQFYSCDNGFKGCCRVNACSPEQCPEGQRTTTSYAVPFIDSSTTSSTTKTSTTTSPVSTTQTNTDGDGDGPSTSSPSTSDNPPDTTPTNPASSGLSSLTSSLPSASTPTSSPISTPTTPAPPTVWVPVPTGAAQPSSSNSSSSSSSDGGGGNEHPRLSTTAIAGISVGGTVAAALLAVVAFLLIRRHRIARRNARAPAANPFAYSPRDAEGFMADHPIWHDSAKGAVEKEAGQQVKQGEEEARKDPGLRGLYELP